MKRSVFRYFVFVVLLLFAADAVSYAQIKQKNTLNEEALEQARLSNLNSAQELCRIIGSQFAVPTINYEPVTPPKFWTTGMLTEVGFSQISLTNWAAGGSGSVALNSYVNAHANYAKGDMYWDNRAQFSYGFIQSFDDGYRKSDDKIVLDSKWGYKAVNKFYFSANFNFYKVHYSFTHVCGNSGGNTADMIESIEMMNDGRLNPTAMITHVGGIDAVIPTTLNLPKIPGGKKLIYTGINMELTAIADFRAKAAESELFAKLADITDAHNGLWCAEAEKALLAHFGQN